MVASVFILVIFLGLAGLALDRAFISSAKVSVRDQLRTQTFALLSVLEVSPNGRIILPAQLPESRLLVPNSGLYAVILNHKAKSVWLSASALGVRLNNLETTLSGSEYFSQEGESLASPFRYSFSISWETEDSSEHEFTLVMIEASDHFISFVNEYRRKIVLWLGLAGAILLLLQMTALRWSLSPLGKVMTELDQIEHARQDRILGTYPEEIAQLSERINLFIARERKNLERYRNTLGDLAHSLKTPLAVMKGMSESGKPAPPTEFAPYLERMGKIVDYQLRRAASSRVSLVQKMIPVEPVFRRIQESLDKVYAHKDIAASSATENDLLFYGDQSDLYELAGNILDNAYKWANSRVHYGLYRVTPESGRIPGLKITVEDDGPGVADHVRNIVLERGVRVDQKVEGQGIGLAVSQEIIERYNGIMEIGASEEGGALITIFLRPTINDA